MTPETVMTRSGDGGLGWSEGKTTLQFWGIEGGGWSESLIIVGGGGGDRGEETDEGERLLSSPFITRKEEEEKIGRSQRLDLKKVLL